MASIRLVLVDSENIFLEGLEKLLKSESGFKVVCKCSIGLEAIKSVRRYQPSIVLMDIKYPECNGIELVRYIHEELPKANIIVFTNSKTDQDLISTYRAGARAYLSKNIDFADLIRSIILVADGGIVVSPPMASRLLAEFNSLEDGKDAKKLLTFLSERERAVLSAVAQGFTNKEIAAILFISENTVKVHLRNIMEKLHAHTRQQAVNMVGGKNLLSGVTQTDIEQV